MKYVIHMIVRRSVLINRGTSEVHLRSEICQGSRAGEPMLFENEEEAHLYANGSMGAENWLDIVGYEVRPFWSVERTHK